jgi:hypothetical protein
MPFASIALGEFACRDQTNTKYVAAQCIWLHRRPSAGPRARAFLQLRALRGNENGRYQLTPIYHDEQSELQVTTANRTGCGSNGNPVTRSGRN